MKDRVDCEWKESEGYLTRVEPDERHYCGRAVQSVGHSKGRVCQPTQVLNILIRCQHQRALLLSSWMKTGTICLVDNDAICCSCCNECDAIRSLCPSGVEIEGDVGKEVSEDTK